MKYIFSKLSEIERKIKDLKHVALLLDFDGTISPIVKKPENAYITEKVRHTLKKINKVFPIIIVTGRPFYVIKKKVKVAKFIYTASHGLEWNLNNKLERKTLPKLTEEKINQIRQIIKNIKKDYPSLIIENKPYSVTFHYHRMSVKDKKTFKGWLKKFLKPIYKQSSIRIFHDKETIDITPNLHWTKGNVAKLALKYLYKKTKRNYMPIYIGDSLTDEDAFIALKKDGITVRVGKNKKSAAKWYLKNQKEVSFFLKWLLSLK